MRGAARVLDTTHYPESDHMGEGELQRLMTELLRPLLAAFLVEVGRPAHVGANQFLYYEQFNTAKRTAPDIYVLSGVDPRVAAPSWKLWELGAAPSFCLEIVSTDAEKDYIEMPVVHAQIGTRELVVYDPTAPRSGRKRSRHVWQVHRRVRGELRLVGWSSADRVAVEELGCFLRVVGAGDARRLRIGLGPRGDALFPTDYERAEEERAAKDVERAEKEQARAEKEQERAEKEQERAEKEQARAEKEQERAAKDVERAARVRLEAEVKRLRAELAARPPRKR